MMNVKKILIAQITVPKVRVTAVYDEELKQLLHDSLETMGQVQPIIVTQKGEDYIVVDGLHRLQEAQARGDTTIVAVVYAGDEKDALLKNLVLNRLRGKTKASEMVTVIGSLFNDHGLDSDAIREQTGLSRDYIERLVRISQASPSVQEALDAEIIGVSHAFEISRLPSFIAQDEVMAKYQVWKWTVKELRDQVDTVLTMIKEMGAAPPASERPVASPRYYCEGCRGEAEFRYLRPVLLCPDCFGNVWRINKAQRLVAVEVIPPVEESENPPK